jgi:putative transcriptional regulator
MSLPRILDRASEPGAYDGQFLIAMPGMEDPRFKRAVVYMCAHSSDGAMGIVINQAAPQVTFPDLLEQLKIIPDAGEIRLPASAERVRVLTGGPVEPARGFVLHSPDVAIQNATLPVDEGVCLTATIDILKAIARGEGPRDAVLALGYAGWGPGQLESEILANGWLTCAADVGMIFDPDLASKYDRALARLGVTSLSLSHQAGRA